MKKVYFDIGVNLLQGFNEIKTKLNIDDSWTIVFVEPNPNFKKTEQYKTIMSMKNCIFYDRALYDDHDKKQIEFYYDEDMDQGGNVYGVSGKNKQIVNTVKIEELVKNYKDCELYFKFDCECAEFKSIPKLLSIENLNIKKIFCEFHCNGEKDADLRILKNEIIQNIKSRNIQYEDWH